MNMSLKLRLSALICGLFPNQVNGIGFAALFVANGPPFLRDGK